ncbi:MAG TPA: ADOP family duplicated permease, partial [Blastocatellia bacterium]|nr:ADOP family duplicated permease [Blastocatellia bacterium]
NYFNALGIQPMLGRTFQESETGPNSAPVIILGYDAWRRLFNGDPDIVGKTLKLSRAGTPPTIIGVMPPGVRFLPSPGASQEPNYNVNAQVDYWAPAAPTERSMKWPVWSVVGRLRNGGVVADAQNELNVIGARQAQEDPHFQDETLRVVGLKAELNGEGARILFPLLGAAALVLLIACGNAAALLLVRGLQRQQEYGIRCALGAGRATLFRLVSIESLLLALLGGGIGAGLAFGIVRLFKLIGGHAIPRLDTVTGGWPIVLCGLAAAVAAAGMAGLIPALRASRLNAVEVIKSAGPQSSVGRRERRLLHGVVTAQTALTLALLAGAGLLIRTMNNLANVQPGYDTRHILTMSVTEVSGREHWMDFHTQALERLARLPGVQHVAFAWGVPLTGNSWPGDVDIEGQPIASNPNDRIQVPLRAVTPDYFALLGQTIVEGRDFRSTDLQTAPDGSPAAENYEPEVAIVNQAFVDRYFPDSEAVGKKIWLDGRDHAATQIIGVVFNTRTKDLTRSSEPEIYLSLWQAHAFSKHLVVGASSEPRALIAAVEHELRTIDPTAAVENVKTLDQIRDESQAPRAFATRLLIGFSFVATVLTLVGIYGVLSLSVAARRREIAIRTAVGADRRAVLNMIVGEGLRLIGGGVVIGLAVAAASSWALRSFLFQVSATDPVTLSEVGLLFLVVALMACWAPARRASKVDPMEALRYE